MAYRNDRTDRARLYRQWVTIEDRACVHCGSKHRREIGHIIPYHQGGETSERNCQVECRACNLARHPFAKFRLGDTVRLNGRTPGFLDFTEYEKTRPRTIIKIDYDQAKQCNYYTLGSNGRGNTKDGQPLDGIQHYTFRSYQLKPYIPRKYHFKRKYTRKGDKAIK